MKVAKNKIRLSENHPSLLLTLNAEESLETPIFITSDLLLIDGYRRFQIHSGNEIETVCLETSNLFDSALECNRRTRIWDDTDCFLWTRWARSLNAPADQLPTKQFDPKLFALELDILRSLANRALEFRQVLAIAQLPITYHSFLSDFLTSIIELNANETKRFIEMAIDLKKLFQKPMLRAVFEIPELNQVLQKQDQTRKQRGENLLKAMRILRYPKYHKRSEEFSSYWQQLNVGQNISIKKSLFLERGLLELTITATSSEDFRRRLQRLCETSNSPLWNKIWEE
jgi:hypothetical protein